MITVITAIIIIVKETLAQSSVQLAWPEPPIRAKDSQDRWM